VPGTNHPLVAPEQPFFHGGDQGEHVPGPAGGPDLTPHPYREKYWADLEYLLWWINRSTLPGVVGRVPAGLASQATLPPGSITTVIGENESDFRHSGVRFTAGGWIDDDQCLGVEVGFFLLDPNSKQQSADSSPGEVIGPTFFDASKNRLAIIVPANPATATEHASDAERERFWGVEANLRSRVCYFGCNSLDVLLGFREVGLREDLGILTTQTGSNSITRFDSFSTRDQFAGVQIGAAFDFREGPWDVNVLGKIAFGGLRQVAEIHGLTTANGNTINEGVLALNGNSGHFVHYDFTTVPELDVKVGYYFTENVRFAIGYTGLVLVDAHRPGDALDFVVNPRNIPLITVPHPSNVPGPVHTFRESDLRAQGLTFDLEFRY
jgi:hypothetical protein